MTVGTITILLWQSISERAVTTTIKKTTGNDRNQSFQFHWRAKQKMREIFWYFDSIHFNFHYFPLALKCGGHSFNQIFFFCSTFRVEKSQKITEIVLLILFFCCCDLSFFVAIRQWYSDGSNKRYNNNNWQQKKRASIVEKLCAIYLIWSFERFTPSQKATLMYFAANNLASGVKCKEKKWQKTCTNNDYGCVTHSFLWVYSYGLAYDLLLSTWWPRIVRHNERHTYNCGEVRVIRKTI